MICRNKIETGLHLVPKLACPTLMVNYIFFDISEYPDFRAAKQPAG